MKNHNQGRALSRMGTGHTQTAGRFQGWQLFLDTDVTWGKLKSLGGNGQLLSPICPQVMAVLHMGVGTECRQTVTFPKILDTFMPLPQTQIWDSLLGGEGCCIGLARQT